MWTASSAADAITHVNRQRRMRDLQHFEPGILDALEQAFPRSKQHRTDVDRQLVDGAGGERLTHGGCAARDVDPEVTGDLAGPRQRGLETVGDEVERRPALHLDRLPGGG